MEQPPVLVVSRESANEALPVVTVLPLADHAPGRRVYPNEALLPSGAAQLQRPAVVMALQIQSIAKARLSHPVGSVDEPGLRSAVSEALRVQLNLEQFLDSGR
jgi:mRNA-degrading endonuclease toxin of MazEF toxin-antitoxin module